MVNMQGIIMRGNFFSGNSAIVALINVYDFNLMIFISPVTG